MHFISLSMPKETSYCLALYGRIPLWLEDMDTSSNAQIVQSEDTISYNSYILTVNSELTQSIPCQMLSRAL